MGYNKDASGNAIGASPLWTLGRNSFKRQDDASEQMNVNGLAAGTPVVIWDGEGTYWTASDQGSKETYAKYDGTYGWDSSPTSLGQDSKFDSGLNQDITQYGTLTFWMQPKAYPVDSDLQLIWKTTGGIKKGNVLSVEDYVTNMDLDVWQQVSVPIADFDLNDDVAKILFKYAGKGGQQFWYDDIKLNTSAGGGPYIYQMSAPANTIYHMSMCVLILAGPSSGWDSDVFASLANALDNGMLLRHRKLSVSEVLWSLNCKDNADLFGLYHPQDDVTFADSILLMGFMVKSGSASVEITDDDVLEFVVRDDLRNLSQARAYAHYGIEVVS